MKRKPNGSGTFVTLKSGNIQLRKRVGLDSNNKQKILTVTASTKTECLKLMKKKEDLWNRTRYDSDRISKGTLTDLCRAHLDDDLKKKKEYKAKSADRREGTINNQIAGYPIGRLQVNAITSRDISEHVYSLINQTELSVSSVRKAFDVINSAFNWAISQEYLSYNPCNRVKDEIKAEFRSLSAAEANERRVMALSDSQIKRFEDTCRTRNENDGMYKYTAGLYALFLLYTGMRCGELCSLKWGDFEEVDGTVYMTVDSTRFVAKDRSGGVKTYVAREGITKNAKARVLALDKCAADVLEEIRSGSKTTEPGDYVALNRSHNPTDASKMGKCINTLYRNAKLPKEISGAHVLRKTFATQKYRAGFDVNMIATYIGDIPSTVWEHYISGQESIDAGEGRGVINYVPALVR